MTELRSGQSIMLFRLMLVAFAGLLLCGGEAQEVSAAERPFRIYMITWREITDVERGFQNYLAEKKIPVEYIMRHTGSDPSRLPGFVEEIRRLKPDLVYTRTSTVTLGIVGRYNEENKDKYITDIPVVFGTVSDPLGVKITAVLASSKRNVTGVYHVASPESTVSAVNYYRPFTRIGMLYNGLEENSVAYIKRMRKLAAKKGFKLLEQTYRVGADGKPSPEGVGELLGSLKQGGAEWLMIGPDSYSTVIAGTLGPALKDTGLPVFCVSEGCMPPNIPGGVLAGLICKYYSAGQFAGYKAEQILVQKKKAADIPIETLKRFSYIIQMDRAKELNFYPPVSMFNYAEIR